jgi:Flp pilus assembly pilin Flp
VRISVSIIRERIVKLLRKDGGQAITEYALLCALIACGVTAGYTGVAQEVNAVFNDISSTLAQALTVPAS